MPMFTTMSRVPVLLLLAVLVPTTHALYFEDGYDHHYTYSSESDILGMHNVTTVIKFRIRHVNESVNMLMVDSLVQHSEHGYVADNALNWKLDHKFFFTAGGDGLVTLVHYHPEEIDEVLSLKKVLASTLSTKVDVEENYASLEEDHTGVLEHVYTADRHTDGLRITKGHKSYTDVHRAFNKTVHLDLKGTPLHIDSLDNVTLRDEPSHVSSNNVDDAEQIPEDISGDFPLITSVSKSKLKLMAKNKHKDGTTHNLADMRQGTLTVKEKAKKRQPLSAVEAEIKKYLTCIHSITNKYDRNRTECVHELRKLITSLHHGDFIQLGKTVLTRQCPDDDVTCIDERYLFIDIVSQEGSADAQLMILNDVMMHPNVTEEDMRRCLFHCVAIASPVTELVDYVEAMCFMEDSRPGEQNGTGAIFTNSARKSQANAYDNDALETPPLTKTRKRACLSLGAMAKSLHEKNTTESDRITEKIENWLGHHDQERSKQIVKPRRRRSIIQHDQRARKHIETKMVLLQSLGNAGKQRSLEHIKSYMAPNAGVTAWRRAAIHSLRHFQCNESAHHLLISAVHDENEVVRKSAMHVLGKRNKQKPINFTVEHENILLSKNYSYPVAARVRRSLLQTLEKGISVQLKTPGIEWDKILGSDKIGASFGLHIRNILDLKLGLLDGHFVVDVYDGAYAEAHVGLIGLQVDIVRAYVCFGGHIKYDLNVLKDFGINSLSDLVHIYDKIVAKIIGPVKEAVNAFKEIINTLKHRSLTDIINTIVRTVKDMPTILGDVASRMEAFVKEVYNIAKSTVMDEIKAVVSHVRNFVDGVKHDILKFYNDIVDSVTMALPYIGKKIMEAFNLIVSGVKQLFNNPMQAITAMSRAVMDVKMAVTMIADVKTQIVKACMFIQGRAAEWMDTAKQIPSILRRLADVFKKLAQSITTRKRRGDLVQDMTAIMSDGINKTKESLNHLEEDLKAKWDEVIAPLRPLVDIVKPFVKEFKAIMHVIEGLKWGYKKLKETIETSKKLVQKVFGPKFHRDFPTERRPKRDSCPEGVWPSNTTGHYSTTGVDLSLGVSQSIKNPVNGIVHIKGHQRVVIQPKDAEFEMFEIVIENINVLPTIKNGISYNAGDKIGRASKAPVCKPNFIHVSVRQKMDKEHSDEEYKYTDPGPFLDRLVPIPKWIKECNDHEFRYIGQTTDSGESVDSEEPDEEKEAIDRGSDFDDGGFGDEDSTYRPDDPNLSDTSTFKDSLMKSMKEQAKKFADFFKTALFGSDGPKVPNILSIVNLGGKKMSWIFDHLKDVSITGELDNVIDGLCSKMTAIPKGNPLTFGIPYVKKLFEMNGLKPQIGDMSQLSDRLMDMAENACPMFRGAIAASFGHVCTVHDDCLGIECSVPLPNGGKTEHVQIGVAVDPKQGKVDVTVNGKSVQNIIADGGDVELDMKVEFFGGSLRLYMTAGAEFHQGVLSLSAEAKLCTSFFHACLPSIELFHNIKFQALAQIGTRHRRDLGKLAMCAGIKALSVPDFMSHLGDFQLLGKKVTGVIDKVRSTVVSKLLDDAVDKLGELAKEFQDKVDFCLNADIPVPNMDLDFFPDMMPIFFMVGPIPMSFTFGGGGAVGLRVNIGLCVLSMKASLTLTPWVGGKVWGALNLDIGFAYGGLKLIGYLMETQFPITAELVFSKYPIDVGAKMDLVLTPIRLKLQAYAKLRLIFVTVTVFEANLWEYSCPTIRKNIFHKKRRDEDKSPPEVMPATIEDRSKREGVRGCIVRQVPGRPYYSPAFTLEMHAQDEVSDIKLSYAIGTHRGGTNVVDWTEMGGSSLLAPSILPGGIPLYWTVKAKNSQGLEATQQCSLDTFDSTLPDGRVEHFYKASSHPHKLKASVVVFEDSPLVETHFKAVGFSPGQFGSQVVEWETLNLDHSVAREGVTGYLKHFTVPREGKLVANILQSQELRTADMCAQKCIQYGQNCVSFSYEYHSEMCDLHDVVEGANAYLRISGTYSNYERLGSGYNTPLEYDKLPLTQGTMYYMNTRVSNVLGYDAFLIGEGTMVDFTPPEPGLIKNAVKDILKADNCTAAVTQQCIDVTWKDNHRIIIDGDGSGTVFNGHEPVFDQLYTLTNHYVTANWKGFHDDESGIWGYTWAVGTTVCGSDVIAFEDPYSHLTSKKFWTDSAFHKGIHLTDGAYYVSVQALNSAELGGSLVTTVCHSTPFMVDTSPPVFNKVTDILYDEDFDLIAIYYDAEDGLSKIAKAEFGLGKTKYDVQLKPYSLHAAMDRDDPFVAVEDLGLQEGVPAWLRIRVTNNVDLFTAGHSEEPILIDKSPPIFGTVLDGSKLRQDVMYQSNDKLICAQWIDFYDKESGIDRFIWGVGTTPKLDNVVKFHNLTHYDKSSCAPASLKHNHTYYSTVFAFNNALNSKGTNSSSDGVLIDTTPPLPGNVFDGKTGYQEQKFTSETVSKYANWRGYHDPESGIADYKVDVFVNGEHKKTFDVDTKTKFEDHTISMEHKDQVHYTVHGINGAELEVTADSDGFLVDHTPPIMTAIADNVHGSAYQSDNSKMNLSWDFYDDESFIREYRTKIYKTKYGVKQQFWPEQPKKYNTTKPLSPTNGKMIVEIDNLAMEDGALYTLHVTALNGGMLATSHETTGVTIDTTAPREPTIRLGLPKEEEEIDELGRVLHNDQHAIRLSWTGRDSESGIEHYKVAIGTKAAPESISPFIDYGSRTTAYIEHINFQSSAANNITYIASIKAINGAGLKSPIGESKEIFVQKANVPGLVFDGRNRFVDEMYTADRTSLAATFYGFESESCNIIGYEWAIGTTEYGTDVLSYTDYGLVMLNDTHGQAQVHIELYESTTYYTTVRAVTGCRDEFILSTSDGITLDMTPPNVEYHVQSSNDTTTVIVHNVLFQDAIDSLALTANVSDEQAVDSTTWALGSLPLLDDQHAFTSDLESLTRVISQQPGQATFITTETVDKAGNRDISSSMAIMSDNTAPKITQLECTEFLSYRQTLLTCNWETIMEYESLIDNVEVTVTTNKNQTVLNGYIIPKGVREFSRDLYHELNTFKSVTSVYATFVISNVVGQEKTYGREVVVDISEPEAEKLEVVTSLTQTPAESHMKCQLPRAYVELRMRGVKDKESKIDTDRYKISLGLKPYGTEIKNYVPVTQRDDGTFFMDGFTLNVGTVFYATLRVYNKAGLYSDFTSDSVVVSQAPYLTVIDGDKEEDVDYQAFPNLIQGRWEYSDLCPIREAKWSVEDLTGKFLFDLMTIPSAGKNFYNDEVALENGKKYIVTVRTVDFLNRTKIARSDGVSVRIQPPFPGKVRDGVDKDVNYQYSNTELSANWDNFGDGSKDPTQSINYYEVAIGNDRRYEKTRSNVHYFVNVGLNTSYIFKNLNLTEKEVRYYITVRSYSNAGGYAEGYSNGIRVGYRDEIGPGDVTLNSYQSQTDSIAVSWTGFQSDIDIIEYMVGISSQVPDLANDTLKCLYFTPNETVYDVNDLKSVGLNEYIKTEKLSLKQGQDYYVTVVAKDEAGMCIAVTSRPVVVDTTPAALGDLFINDVKSEVVSFATSDSEMHVRWANFKDPESGIRETKVALLECNSCHPKLDSQDCVAIAENVVHNDIKTAFYDIELYPAKSYIVRLDMTNGARLHTVLSSATILIDSTPPLPGEVKISKDWNMISYFQHSTSAIRGIFAIAGKHEDYVCSNQNHFFPTNPPMVWHKFTDNFTNEFSTTNRTGAYLGIGYSSDLSKILKSGLVSQKQHLTKGNYTFAIRTAAGHNIITTAAFISDSASVPFTINDKPRETHFDTSRFDNMTGLQPSNDNETDTSNTTHTTTTATTSTVKPTVQFVQTNGTEEEKKTVLDKIAYGFGIHFLGYKIDHNQNWWHVFWARNKFTNIQRWFRLPTDPTISIHKYTVNVKKHGASSDTSVDLTLYVNDEEVVSISGFEFSSDMKLSYLTWNEEDYKPPINDIFNPFYREATLSEIVIPDATDKSCFHGRGFYDGESGIKEIQVGVSDSPLEPGTIIPMKKYQTFCFPCIKPCDDMCHKPCNDTRLKKEFNILPIHIDGLALEPTHGNDTCLNASLKTECNSTSYYLNAKLINFAGEETLIYSNGIQIDVTPPECEYVRCLDPKYDDDAPTTYLGSNSSFGAYWDCKEDVSSIQHYTVQVISEDSKSTIMKSTNVGLKTKVKFDLGNGMFEHRKHYNVQVTATNTAGLSLTSTCSVHVFLYPPSVDSASFNPIYTDGSVVVDDEAPLWTSSQDTVGMEWQGGSNETEFYEWQIGSSGEQQDIFPAVKVGQDASGSAAIEGGRLKLDKTLTNATMQDFLDRRNMTMEEVDKLNKTSERKKAFFFMEPGRCMHQNLYAIGFSHRKSKMRGRTVCIKRLSDAKIDASEGRHFTVSKAKSSQLWQKKTVPSPEITIDAELTSGSLSVGTISADDRTSDYGSAATADYKPYISDPGVTAGQTTRMLRNRIQRFCNVTFFVAPSPSVDFEYLKINVTVPQSCDKDPDYQPALIYWDVEKQSWAHTDEGCYDSPTSFMDVSAGIYMAEVCDKARQNSRKRRQTTSSMKTPHAYELARIARAFPNGPPSIDTDILHTEEDAPQELLVKQLVVQTSDPEDDHLIFELLENAQNAECSIGNTTGKLNCTLEDDFYGENSISVRVTETGLPGTEQPNVVEKNITLNIKPTPDETERFFLDRFGKMHRDVKAVLYHSLTVEANGTDTVFAGTIILADKDGEEVFTETTEFTALGDSTFTLEKVDLKDVRKQMFTRHRTIQAYNVNFKFSPDMSGNMTLKFIAQTATGNYTPSVTMHVYVLEHPCVYGECSHSTLGKFACDSTDRATTFDGYMCACSPGYVGTWCEIEINECEQDPCSTLFDCEDLVNAYECNINVGKLMAILICCTLAVVGIGFLVYKLKKRYDENKLRQSQVSLTSGGLPYEVDPGSRPLTPFLSDKPATPTIKAPPVFTNTAFLGDEVDLSALSGLTAAPGYKLPPHHPHRFGPGRTSFNPETIKGAKSSRNTPSFPETKNPRTPFNPAPESSGEMDRVGSGVITVGGYAGGTRGPTPRCPSAASQKTVSTIDGDQIRLGGNLVDIDV